MKKSILVIFLACLSLVLIACGASSKDNKQGKNSSSDDVSIKLNSGDYLAVTEYDDKEEQTYLKLNVTVHNKYKKKILLSDNNFKLYDKNDEEIESTNLSSAGGDSVKEIFGSISSQKKKTGDIAFSVNPEEKYELHYTPEIYYDNGDEPKDLVITIDPSKYKNETENAKNALTAYMDTVFLNNENEDFKTLLANDVIKESQKFDEELGQILKDAFDVNDLKPSLKLEKKFIESYRVGLNKKIKPKYLIEYADSKTAKIKVTFNRFDSSDMLKQVRKVSEQFAKKNQSKYTYKELDKAKEDSLNYTFSRFDQILSNTDLDSYENEYTIILTSSDGKWTVNTTDDNMNSEYNDMFESFLLEYY